MERKKIYDTKFIQGSDEDGLKQAASYINEGLVVGFPTETVYGLGADALNAGAVTKIFEAKGRPGDNPLIVHIWDKSQINDLVSEITPAAQALIDAFMPGPITVIMKKKEAVPDEVTAGLDTVGIRMPSHSLCNKFLKLCGCPVAAPSANLSGSPSPTTALRHVRHDRRSAQDSFRICGCACERSGARVAGNEVQALRPRLRSEDPYFAREYRSDRSSR